MRRTRSNFPNDWLDTGQGYRLGFLVIRHSSHSADVLLDGIVIRALGPGDVFGEIAVLSGGRRTATVVARTPMQLVTVLNRDVWRLEREAPAVGAALRSRIAEHLEPAAS